jgi:hypothetical protein
MDPYSMGMGGMGYGGGMGMGGGMGGSTGMMMSGLSSICFCLIAAIAVFFIMSSSSSESSSDDDFADVDMAALNPPPVVDNVSGAKLLTVGGLSMVVEGSSCGNGTVRFSEAKNGRWVWKLVKAGEYQGVPTYSIESWYKNFGNACDKRFLTAPTNCASAPYLGSKEYGPRQLWILVGDATNGYQIRNLACVKGRASRSYLMQSAGNKNDKPFFSSGSGSSFMVEAEYGSG